MKPRVRVSTVIPARPAQVWADVSDLASHVEWMDDAVAIRFTTPNHAGVGTAFECATKLGPLRLTDRMTVTGWAEGRQIQIRHEGVIKGDGVFTLRRKGRRSTRFTWTERLTFPWWLGGPAGALIGGQVLRFTWRRDLRNLRARF